jgi:hypothetical protein
MAGAEANQKLSFYLAAHARQMPGRILRGMVAPAFIIAQGQANAP